MRRRLAPSLVVTLSAAAGACNATPTKTTVATADPTPAKLDASPSATVVASVTPRKRTPHEPPAKPGKNASYGGDADPLNPQDPEHGAIYVSWQGDTCFVHVPFPKGTKLTSWVPPPTKTVDCPPSMDDATWDACRGGVISKRKDTGVCTCFQDGNPPPPPVEVDCPKVPPTK